MGLFFQVLARKHDERNEDVNNTFEKVPYLNSSLFEPTDIEQETIFISNLKDDKKIPLFSQTVLKDPKGQKLKGEINALEYLFAFLDAYDFSSEGSEEIQEDNKTLINASVLGLIFEKINGYRDGSFFTPGFITMYMCRETIRRAVVQKFNETKGWNCKNLEELYDKIEDRQEANEIINSIKICDPAVGSGHFLVSALNEMIAVKNDLKILQDRNGKRLKEYHVEVVNDELIVTDEEGELFEYNPNSKESQRVQETLFHEKQTIIENCLFGVDINPNSVKICRLRLWIELLKNAYYKNKTELETLPNIDINIKCGNSLVSRFAIDADLKQALKKSKWTIEAYRTAVATYRNAQNKEQKREMEHLIADIKSDFRSEISMNDPKMKKLRKLQGELYLMTNQPQLFEMNKKEKAAWNKKVQQLTEETKKLEAEIEAIKANKIFENAFEWRFEFPEVLNDEGDFVGFDVVIGNPPYIQLQKLKEVSEQLKRFGYQTYDKMGDIYALFYERGVQILKPNGYLSYITSNKWMRAGYGKNLRNFFLTHTQPELLIDLGSGIFEEATVDANILILKKQPFRNPFLAADVSKEKQLTHLNIPESCFYTIRPKIDEAWTIASEAEQRIKAKIEAKGKPLKEWDVNIYRGVLTGLNKAFIISTEKRTEILANCQDEEERKRTEAIIKPILRGRDIKRYYYEWAELWVIGTFPALKLNIDEYPALKKYFLDNFDIRQLEQSGKKYPELGFNARKKTTNKWFETQDQIAYYPEFEKEKVVYPNMATRLMAIFDIEKFYTNQKCFIITGENLKYITGLFNSEIVFWYFKNMGATLGREGYEMSKIFMQNLPLPPITASNQGIVSQIESLVDKILSAKKQDKNADTTQWEQQIDNLVYSLYELTEEVKIIEG